MLLGASDAQQDQAMCARSVLMRTTPISLVGSVLAKINFRNRIRRAIVKSALHSDAIHVSPTQPSTAASASTLWQYYGSDSASVPAAYSLMLMISAHQIAKWQDASIAFRARPMNARSASMLSQSSWMETVPA